MKFKGQVIWDVDIEIADDLIKGVLTDEWRSHFYPLKTPEDVAAHLAFNLVQGRTLESLDGFADRPNTDAKLLYEHTSTEDFERTNEVRSWRRR